MGVPGVLKAVVGIVVARVGRLVDGQNWGARMPLTQKTASFLFALLAGFPSLAEAWYGSRECTGEGACSFAWHVTWAAVASCALARAHRNISLGEVWGYPPSFTETLGRHGALQVPGANKTPSAPHVQHSPGARFWPTCGVAEFNAAISSCEKDGFWEIALELLACMAHTRVEANVVSYNAAISACGKSDEWEHSTKPPDWGQILAYMLSCKVAKQEAGTPEAESDTGFKVLTSSDAAQKRKKFSAHFPGLVLNDIFAKMLFQAQGLLRSILLRSAEPPQ